MYEYDNKGVKDRLISYNGKPIVYSDECPGFIKFYDGKNFSYEGSKLVQISKDENNKARYTYNSSGLRIKKVITINGIDKTINYFYDGNKLITELSNDYRIDFLYDEYNQLYGFITNDVKYFYVRDVLKNILGIISQNGELVVKYNYTAYGELLSMSGSLASTIGELNPFRYRGYYYDIETGLFMVGHRYYNPEWGRWLSPDDIEYLDPHSINGLNLYAYYNNDPVNKYDPTGHFAVSAIFWGAVIGFASVYIPDVIENIKKDGFQINDLATINEENRLEYAVNTIGGALTGLIGELGINTLVSAPLIGVIDTGVAYLSGDINSWDDAAIHFGIYTFISGLTLGTQRIAAKYQMPKISRGIPTAFNRFIEKSSYMIEKAIYHYGQKVDDAVAIIMISFGVY